MRKFVFTGLIAVLAFAALITTGALLDRDADLVQADSPNAAFITKDFVCGLLDGDGGFVITNDGNHSVVTSSGHTTLICKVKGVANSTGKAVILRGFGCFTFLGFTTDSKEIISASGKATLRCRI